MLSRQELNNFPPDTFTMQWRVHINLPLSRLAVWFTDSVLNWKTHSWVSFSPTVLYMDTGPAGSFRRRGEYTHYTHWLVIYVESCRELMPLCVVSTWLWFVCSGCGSRYFWEGKVMWSLVGLHYVTLVIEGCVPNLTHSCAQAFELVLHMLKVFSQKETPGKVGLTKISYPDNDKYHDIAHFR